MSWTFTPACVDDLPALHRLVIQAAHDPLTIEQLQAELDRDHAHVLTARNTDGALVGYVLYWWVADEMEIHDVAVDPAHRRQGIASQLLQQVIERAQTEDCAHIALELRKSNAAALALYRSLGFESVGTRKGYYRLSQEDAVLMRRTF